MLVSPVIYDISLISDVGKAQATLLYAPIKDLLQLAETSFHWLWQILMSTSDELNLAHNR